MTAKTDKLRRAYGKLTPYERVALLLAAEERDDWRELHALEDTCPAADLPPYVTRLLALQHAACLVVVQLLARELLLVAHAPASDGDPALLSPLQEECAMWRAFVAWCAELNHDPHQALRLAPIGRDDAEPARFLLDLLVERFETGSAELSPDPDRERYWGYLFRGPFSL